MWFLRSRFFRFSSRVERVTTTPSLTERRRSFLLTRRLDRALREGTISFSSLSLTVANALQSKISTANSNVKNYPVFHLASQPKYRYNNYIGNFWRELKKSDSLILRCYSNDGSVKNPPPFPRQE